MKAGCQLKSLCLLLMVAMLAAGCATKRPLVNAWRNPQFTPTPTNTIALTIRSHPDPENVLLGRMVVDELKRQGLAVVPEERAKYLLAYILNDISEEKNWVNRHPAPINSPAPQTTGEIYEPRYQSNPPMEVVSTPVYHATEIQLYLYTNPRKDSRGMQLIWQGTITFSGDPPPDRELALVKKLMEYFGKNHSGRVDLAQ